MKTSEAFKVIGENTMNGVKKNTKFLGDWFSQVGKAMATSPTKARENREKLETLAKALVSTLPEEVKEPETEEVAKASY